jgi:hypothetical protein
VSWLSAISDAICAACGRHASRSSAQFAIQRTQPPSKAHIPRIPRVCCGVEPTLTAMRRFLLSFVSMLLTWASSESERHMFTAGEHIVTMDVRFGKPYVGTRLVFYDDKDPLKPICFTGNGENGACPTRFVGAVAMVTFTVKRAASTLGRKTSIREHVTVMAQSPDLPPRPPFDRTQVISKGSVNDLQAFGYDESDIAEREREAEREKSRERLWRLCRQELYLNGETVPFAVIHWRYTIDSVEILQVQSGAACSK